jgi:predicted dehydrogenase
MSPLAVGIVGAGLSARSHALDIITDEKMELAGVVAGRGSSAATFADTFACDIHADLSALLRQVDALIVAVPPAIVLDIVEQIARCGTPCLAEKPVAVTRSDWGRLGRLADSRIPVVAPFNRRYATHTRWAARELARGAIGTVTEVDAVWVGPFRDRFAPDAPTYRATAGSRHGVLLDSGSHALDLLSLLLGDLSLELEDVDLLQNASGAEVAARLDMRHRTGARVRLIIDDSGPVSGSRDGSHSGAACGTAERWTCTVRGETGKLVVDGSGARLRSVGAVSQSRCHPAGELDRPVTDLRRLLDGTADAPLGTSLLDVFRLSDLLIRALEADPARHWVRPRGKALGRLNGACL